MISLNKVIHKPTRMCVLCRDRKSQIELLRFRMLDNEIIEFNSNKKGRSFYICKKCKSDNLQSKLDRYIKSQMNKQKNRSKIK